MVYDHTMYALKPKHRLFSQIPVINDELPSKIMTGGVVLKPNIQQIRGSSVIFEDGSVIEKVDVIVFATGYNYGFPFMPPDVMHKSGHRVGLYKHVFPPTLEHPTLAVVGFIHGLGAIMPMAEMQARWATRVFIGHKKLPSKQTMLKAVDSDTKNMEKNYITSKLVPLQVDFVSYMDDLAGEMGARPSLAWLFLTDYPLFKKVLWGPVTAYQYRLTGPGKWSGARQAIFTQLDRVFQPFKTRKVEGNQDFSVAGHFLKFSIAAVVGGGAGYYLYLHPPSCLTSLLNTLHPQSA
ncbi:hypothetical protein UPYG_G00028580 [Umbra pygmaea]|uniref:Flavin-containing monooxygenase n=1 Tax=Umbra pygmaea TaxID=75934 RepID=A0ABD0Y0U0_UMBPY